MRVLVVDDDPSIRAMLEYALYFEDFEVESAPDGETALEMLKTTQPDVILLDVMMPRIDGLEVARRIREDAALAHIPVIMLSAMTQDSDIMAGWVAGASSYLTKPVDVDMLVSEISRVISERSVALA
jgi:DNA-binding response OmpR family regulator